MPKNKKVKKLLHKGSSGDVSGGRGGLLHGGRKNKQSEAEVPDHRRTADKTENKKRGWKVIWSEKVYEDLENLSNNEAQKIVRKIESYLIQSPTELGKPLSNNLSGLYSYRMGYYRIIYEILNDLLIIRIVKVGHRKDVYDD